MRPDFCRSKRVNDHSRFYANFIGVSDGNSLMPEGLRIGVVNWSFFLLNILHAVLMLSSIQLVWPWCSLYCSAQSILQCAVYPISVTRRCSAHRGLAMLNDDPFRLLGCWMIVVCLGPKGLQWLCDRAMWMELHLFFPPIFFSDVSDKCLVQPITEELLGCNPGSLLLCFHMAVIWTSHESWSVRYLAIVVLFWANKLQTWICVI